MSEGQLSLFPVVAPYRGHPPAQPVETSQAAAQAIRPVARGYGEKVFEILKAAGVNGMTDHEIAMETRLMLQTVVPRRRELVLSEEVVDSGLRRPTPSGRSAIVWILRGFRR